LDPWILNFSAKTGWFLSFEWEKPNFTTFGPPRKTLEKSPDVPLPGKNPSDAHDLVLFVLVLLAPAQTPRLWLRSGWSCVTSPGAFRFCEVPAP